MLSTCDPCYGFLFLFDVFHLNRHLLAFIFIPVIQKEMEIFRETVWNSHRVRSQKDAEMPKGIPNHLYSFPEQYNTEECGMGMLLNIFMFRNMCRLHYKLLNMTIY